MAGAQLPRQGTVRAGPTSVEGLVCRSVGSEWAWRGGLRGELGCVQVIVCCSKRCWDGACLHKVWLCTGCSNASVGEAVPQSPPPPC